MLSLTWKEFTQRITGDAAFRRRLATATSVGPTASALGMTRQGVHDLLKRGKLDGFRIIGADGSTDVILIFQHSVAARAALSKRVA